MYEERRGGGRRWEEMGSLISRDVTVRQLQGRACLPHRVKCGAGWPIMWGRSNRESTPNINAACRLADQATGLGWTARFVARLVFHVKEHVANDH